MGLFTRNSEPLSADFERALMFRDAKAFKVVTKRQQRIRDRTAELNAHDEVLVSIITCVSESDCLVLTTNRIVKISSIHADFDLNLERSVIGGTEIGALGSPPHSFLAVIRLNRPVRQLGGKREYVANDFVMVTRHDYDEALRVTSTVRGTLGVDAL